MNTNFKVIGFSRLVMKSESTVPEADALTTRPSDLGSRIRINLLVCANIVTVIAINEKSARVSHSTLDSCSYAATNWTEKDHFMVIKSQAAHWQIICVLFLKSATYYTSKKKQKSNLTKKLKKAQKT